ncbi:MAG: 2OG-Fe(II) oxygenase, partial [Sphingomicrobium sp.]
MTMVDEMLDFDRIAAVPVTQAPYPHAIISDSILPAAARALAGALPSVTEHGSLRFNEIDRSPELDALIAELESDRFRALMEAKFDIDLAGLTIFHTYRGMMRRQDGVIHTDTPAKTLTILLYLNPPEAEEKVPLRLLNSSSDLEDYFAEVPSSMGTMLLFKVTDNCWHGHKSMVGPRHSLQLNYLSGIEMQGHERLRRRFA